MARLRDFTYSAYRALLEAYLDAGYALVSYEEYLQDRPDRFVILRHDVDKRPANSVQTARIESSLEVSGSYYFRSTSESFQPRYIEQIASLGHEVGYHYEELSLTKGDYSRAIELFRSNLDRLRQYYPVKTMCMHGSPLSKWDNKLLWKEYDYREFGIIAEPYFDIDFNNMLYLTDTGRTWAQTSANLRDRAATNLPHDFSSTFDIVAALEKRTLPDAVMQNIHPQRWNDNYASWLIELIMQNLKNVAKSLMSRR